MSGQLRSKVRLNKHFFITVFIIFLFLCTAYFLHFLSNKKALSPEIQFKQIIMTDFRGDVVCISPDDKKMQKIMRQSFEWFKNRAENGDASAQFLIGAAYFNGFGNEINTFQAKKWLYKAASNGYAPAQAAYALFLLSDNITKFKNQKNNIFSVPALDQPGVFEWLYKSAAQGDPNGEYLLSAYYLQKGDSSRSIELLEKSANNHFALAESSLGACYFYGLGLPKDYEKALYWFKRSLDHNPISADAMHAVFAIQFIYAENSPLHNKEQHHYWINKQYEIQKLLDCEK